MVFDWDKAAKQIAEKRPCSASAGLRDDWEWTGGIIYRDGKPDMKSHTFLASRWAVPELMMDGEVTPCYVMESQTEWTANTKWPISALKILGEV
jgi:hypothetical protein